MLSGGGPLTLLTSGGHILIRGTRLEPTGELELYLRALSSGHGRLPRNTMMLSVGRRRLTDFLQDNVNIWQAARFLGPKDSLVFDTIPPLERQDKSITQGKEEQAEELLQSFFLPLQEEIADEPIHYQHSLVLWLELIAEEVERKVFAASS
jgi:hypothetical protein